MDPLSVTASIITVIALTGAVIRYLNDVKDAPKDRARCAVEAASVQSLLTRLRYRLDEAVPENPWLQEVRMLAVKNGPIDQFKAAMEQLEAKLRPKVGLNKVGETLVWKLTKTEVAEILSRIERLKSLTQIALEMDHFKLSQAIKSDTTCIKGSITNLAQEVDSIQQNQEGERHRAVLEWLSPGDFAAQQTDFISKRQKGTGLWFINSPEFAEWLHGSKQNIFCPGIPGAGKTMIASIATAHLWEAYQEDDVGIAYLYCNYKRREEQNAVKLLAVILKQLIQGRRSVSHPVDALYELHSRRGTWPSFDEISKSLGSVLSNFSRVFIIVDALDECMDVDGTRNMLLSELRILQAQTDLRLMVTSRPIASIVQTFEDDLCLEIRASDGDVKRYLEGQMSRRPSPALRDAHLRQLIKERIVETADGMFLLAQLYMDSLIYKPTAKAIKVALTKLSTGAEALNKAYDGARERIEGQAQDSCDLAKGVISWITHARRPLTIRELQHGLAVEIGERQLDQDNIADVEEMVAVCAGLVTVDEESNIIRLVHYTTQDYFERIRDAWIPDAPANIVLTCITYLSFHTFAIGRSLSDEDFEDRLAQNELLDYASRYWGTHAGRVEEKVKDVALPFLRDKPLIACASQAMWLSRYHSYQYPQYSGYSQWTPTEVTALHLLAFFGLKDLLAYILEDNIEADPKDSEGRTPLSWAAEDGHEEAVKLLLARDDIDADSKSFANRTPLSYAADRGHQNVVQLLLSQHDVAADTRDTGGRTPLLWAAIYRHEEVIKLLLARDDVAADSQNNEGRTSLSFAAGNGHEEVVKLLLARDDVDVNSKTLRGRTPLSSAAENGHKEVVKLLLAHEKIIIDSKDFDGQTPLSLAVGNGHQEVVELLLARDAR